MDTSDCLRASSSVLPFVKDFGLVFFVRALSSYNCVFLFASLPSNISWVLQALPGLEFMDGGQSMGLHHVDLCFGQCKH